MSAGIELEIEKGVFQQGRRAGKQELVEWLKKLLEKVVSKERINNHPHYNTGLLHAVIVIRTAVEKEAKK